MSLKEPRTWPSTRIKGEPEPSKLVPPRSTKVGAAPGLPEVWLTDRPGLNTYYAGLRREQQLYYFLLGNGATRNEAIAPFVRQALIKAFSPGIANMAVTGLVALPGTMIGQILGGSSPHVAIKYQIMIVVITVVASMLSLMMTIFLASRKSFDSYGRLLRVHKDTKRK